MKLSATSKRIIVEISCLLYVFLFIYAAVSKLIDFENFQIQLGQSPLLSEQAGIISWLVPLFEIIIALALFIPRLRTVGLYLAFALMVMFTVYIIIILNFSSFVPCSCGGILEKMGWTEHLIFNVSFILLALIALTIQRKQTDFQKNSLTKFKSFIISIIGVFTASTVFVIALYMLSEEKIHRNNSFLRRYPPHPVTLIKGVNIKYNSYYIAGMSGDRIFLGNTSAPTHVISIDTMLTDIKTFKLQLDNSQKITFYSPQLRIHDSNFFLIDGDVPVIFKGNISDWKAQLYWKGNGNTFSQVESVSPTQFVFRSLDKISNQNVIGRIDLKNPDTLKTSDKLLQKQIDGIFDTDGMLRYNPELDRLVYVYFYRNEFLIADTNLKLDYRGHTIDSIKKASIKIVSKNSGQVTTLAERPIIVNQHSCSSGKYLFIKSDRLGRFEPEEMLKDASIIDVYDLEKQTYKFSFYLYDYKTEKIRSFQIYKNILIGLSEHYLVLYRLQPLNFDLKEITN